MPIIYTANTKNKVKFLPKILIALGLLFIIFSVLLFTWIFFPVAKVEINYSLNKPKQTIAQLIPIDPNFDIIIPKIGANARIIPQVDPYNSNIYQVALTKGVAQAKGTAFPNQTGNMFLFSHSSANIIEATRFNSVFYLLSKLKKNDEIYIYYKKSRIKYIVSDIKIVDPSNVSYLNSKSNTKQLTLMTCWPAGTDYKRLIVIAKSK